MTNLILAVPPPDKPPSEPESGGGSPFSGLLPLLLILVVFMVLMPLFSKKERKRRTRLTTLKKHDKVVTSGGIFGTIVSMDENTVTLEVSRDVRMKFKRSAMFDVERATEAGAEEGAPRKGGRAEAKN